MGLTRDIFKDTAIYSSGMILGKLAGFILLPFYAHIFNTEGYGILGMVETGTGFLQVLFAKGFSSGIIRIYHEEEASSKGTVLTTAIWMVWIIGLLIIPLPLIFSPQISSVILGNPGHANIIRLAIIGLLFEMSGICASTYLLIHRKAIYYSAAGLVNLFLGILLNIWLVIILGYGLYGVFIASLINAVFMYLVFHWPVIRRYGWSFDRDIAKKLMRFQLPLLPGDTISFLSRQMERILVRFLIGLKSLGVLEMAYKFPPLLNMFITLPFLRSWRTKSIEIGHQDDAPLLIGQMFTRYYFLMVLCGLVMAVTIHDVIVLLTPPGFWAASSIAKIEIITTILAGSISSFEFGLVYMKRTKTLSMIVSFSSLLKIVISYFMISLLGLSGAAYSACICAFIQLCFVAYYSQRSYRVLWETRKIALITCTAVVLAIVIHHIRYDEFFPAIYICDNISPVLIDYLNTTVIGTWKSGKLLSMFQTKQLHIISLLFNSMFACTFILVIPIIRRMRSQVVPNNVQ